MMDGWMAWHKNAPYLDALWPKAVVTCASHHLQSSPCTYLYINLQYPSVPFSPAFVLPWLVVDFADRRDVLRQDLLGGFGWRRCQHDLLNVEDACQLKNHSSLHLQKNKSTTNSASALRFEDRASF